MFEKIDNFIKGWKRHGTTGIYAIVTAFLANYGVDLPLYMEHADVIWTSLFATYMAIMTFLKAISKEG